MAKVLISEVLGYNTIFSGSMGFYSMYNVAYACHRCDGIHDMDIPCNDLVSTPARHYGGPEHNEFHLLLRLEDYVLRGLYKAVFNNWFLTSRSAKQFRGHVLRDGLCKSVFDNWSLASRKSKRLREGNLPGSAPIDDSDLDNGTNFSTVDNETVPLVNTTTRALVNDEIDIDNCTNFSGVENETVPDEEATSPVAEKEEIETTSPVAVRALEATSPVAAKEDIETTSPVAVQEEIEAEIEATSSRSTSEAWEIIASASSEVVTLADSLPGSTLDAFEIFDIASLEIDEQNCIS